MTDAPPNVVLPPVTTISLPMAAPDKLFTPPLTVSKPLKTAEKSPVDPTVPLWIVTGPLKVGLLLLSIMALEKIVDPLTVVDPTNWPEPPDTLIAPKLPPSNLVLPVVCEKVPVTERMSEPSPLLVIEPPKVPDC